MITIANLEELGACPPALAWFQGAFPDGAELKQAWAACPEDEWLVWYTCFMLPGDKRQALAYRFAGQAFRYAAQVVPSLSKYADAVNQENVKEARTACAAAWYAAEAARYAARYAAGDTGNTGDREGAGYAWYVSSNAAGAACAARTAGAVWSAEDADGAAAREEQARWCWEALNA